MEDFKRAKKVLREKRKQENKKARTKVRDAGGLVSYNRAKRVDDRKELLDRLVPDRRCKVCKVVKTRSRQWVIVRRSHAICRACFMKMIYYKVLSVTLTFSCVIARSLVI